MPMIDVFAAAGTFKDKPALTKALNEALLHWEKVPTISLFLENTAAFVHELPPDALATASGENSYVRVNVLTPVGVLGREQQLGVVKDMTDILARAAGDPTLVERTWVIITEAPDGGWGIDGHAYTRAEIGEAAKRALSGT